MVRAVRRRDGNTPVPDGDGVAAACFPGDGKLLIDAQIYGSDNLSPAADLSVNGVVAGQQKEDAQSKAGGDRQILAKQLGISPHQLSYVTHSGEGEGLLFYGATILPFVDHFPKNTELYRIMTTKPQELKKEDE